MHGDYVDYFRSQGSCDAISEAYGHISIADMDDFNCPFDKSYTPTMLYAVENVSVPTQTGTINQAQGG